MLKKQTALAGALSLIFAVVRTFIVYNNMEKNIYETDTYYVSDNFLSKLFLVGFFVCLALFVFFALRIGKGKRVVANRNNELVSVVSCALGFVLLGAVIIFVYNALIIKNPVDKFAGIVALFSVLSGVVFLLMGLKACSKKLLGFGMLLPIFMVVFRLLKDFIGANSAPLASSGAYHIMGLALLLLFLLCEGKGFLSKGSAMFYYAYGYCAMMLLAVYALPNLILHSFGILQFDYDAAFSVADLFVAIYIYGRLASGKLKSLEPAKA